MLARLKRSILLWQDTRLAWAMLLYLIKHPPQAQCQTVTIARASALTTTVFTVVALTKVIEVILDPPVALLLGLEEHPLA